MPVGDRLTDHRLGETVDLEEEDAGHIGGRRRLEPVHHPADGLALPDRIVVDREPGADGDADDRHEERGDDGGHDGVDGQPVENLTRQPQDQPVGHEAEEPGRPQDDA